MNIQKSSLFQSSFVAALGLFGGSFISAATITWGTAENIVNSSDVLTTGTLEYAVTLGSAVTFGGVAFSAETYTDSAGTTSLGADIDLTAFNRGAIASSAAAAPFTSLDSSYQTLLGTTSRGDGGVSSVITLKNLTSGQDYAVQIWANRSEAAADWTIQAGGTATLDVNNTNAIGGIGQFVIGTFTADAASQSFAYTQVGGGGGRTGFNALQVRVIPEPGTFTLLSVFGLAFFIIRRRGSKG